MMFDARPTRAHPPGAHLDPQLHFERLLWAAERAAQAAPDEAKAAFFEVVALGRALLSGVDGAGVRRYLALARASASWPRKASFVTARRLLDETGFFLHRQDRLGSTSFLARAVAMFSRRRRKRARPAQRPPARTA